MRIVLASGSASRAALLRGAGVEVDLIPSRVDEETAKAAMRAEKVSPHEQAMRLAELKALKVSSAESGLVIGGDQMMSCADAVFDKPPNLAAAKETLTLLQGRSHHLETATVIAENGQVVWRHLERPKLTMRSLNDSDVDAYLETVGDDVLSTVGAYKLEAEGIRLFSGIEGDYFAILGLPLLPVLDYLRTRKALPW